MNKAIAVIKSALKIESLWLPAQYDPDADDAGEFQALAMMKKQFESVVEEHERSLQDDALPELQRIVAFLLGKELGRSGDGPRIEVGPELIEAIVRDAKSLANRLGEEPAQVIERVPVELQGRNVESWWVSEGLLGYCYLGWNQDDGGRTLAITQERYNVLKVMADARKEPVQSDATIDV